MKMEPVYLAQTSWESKGCATNINGTVVPTIQGFVCVFSRILNTVLTFAGVAVLVMFVLGGFKLMTAGGDAKKAQAANQTLTYAIIGLVAMVGSYFILVLLGNFVNMPLTSVEIPTPAPAP